MDLLPGLVLVGFPPPDLDRVDARYAARGFTLARVDLDPAAIPETGLERIKAAIDALRARPTSNGRVGVAGYGAGGGYAFLAGTRLGADAVAVFRGIGIGALLHDAQFARVPMSFHFGDDDPRVPVSEVRTIKGALEGIGVIEIYRYEVYDEAAAEQAERRAFEVLAGLRDRAG